MFAFDSDLLGSIADLKIVLDNDRVFDESAAEAFPIFNKSHLICIPMPARSGDVRLFFSLSICERKSCVGCF